MSLRVFHVVASEWSLGGRAARAPRRADCLADWEARILEVVLVEEGGWGVVVVVMFFVGGWGMGLGIGIGMEVGSSSEVV